MYMTLSLRYDIVGTMGYGIQSYTLLTVNLGKCLAHSGLSDIVAGQQTILIVSSTMNPTTGLFWIVTGIKITPYAIERRYEIQAGSQEMAVMVG